MKYAYGYTETEFSSALFNSVDEAVVYAKENGEGSFYIGEWHNPVDSLSPLRVGYQIIEMLDETLIDEIDFDGKLVDLTTGNIAELGRLVLNFVRKHNTENVMVVKNVVKVGG